MMFANYGQPAALYEWRAMQLLRTRLDLSCPVHELPLTTVFAKAMQAAPGMVGPRLVPHRNLIMLAHALNWAEHLGADEVWYGAIRDDQRDYPDCRPRFVLDLNHALTAWDHSTLSGAEHPEVRAPLSASSKAEVVAEARAMGILDICWSCYSPTGLGMACGACNSCVSRQTA